MKKYYYGAVAFYLMAVIAYIGYQYTQQRSALVAEIDQRLIQCARVTDQLLPPSVHTPVMNAGSVSPEHDRQNRLVLSRFAETMSVKYVYSFVLEKGKIYFTSSSATSEELKSGEDISYFFDEYADASPILFKAFKTGKIQFDETIDQWGHFRSVFLPHISPSGRIYITAADIEVSNINAQLNALLLRSMGEALFYMLILFPFFIAYRMHNLTIQKELTAQVDERTADLRERSVAVKRLLDNANQGFLTFSASLAVDNEYSQKCVEIFQEKIEGKNIGELLYPDDAGKKMFFDETVRAVFDEEDDVKTEAILSLLQHEFILHHKAINVVYKQIEKSRFMLILTDVTDKKNLEKNIERERNRLKMIVSAISNSDELFELLEGYQSFLSQREFFVTFEHTPLQNLTELYRTVHTYKGLFAQKDFITTQEGLHKVESRLSLWLQEGTISNKTIQTMLNKIDFELWLKKDIDILRDTLGDDFMDKKSTITIDEPTFEKLQAKIVELIDAQPDECHELLELLEVIKRLKYKPIGEYFTSLAKYVELLGERLEKSLNPMEIRDETTFTVGDEFRGFAKSLIHVIRNSVDHGIESPEKRVENDKEEYGNILFIISETDDSLILEISDDGRGIDREKLKQKAIEGGFRTSAELENDEAVIELLFEDYLSTKEEISDLSGRGVGLASVRSEVLKLGGSYRVTSELGRGTRFTFIIPKKSLIKAIV
ncbi:MAG: ATP-binding protein [Sulfuricurvum sp.]|uniref:ATP-binding protein n=1 Tax=Sulfuricurvum sp. TaxID=2025608 RepID=UPI0027345FEF|nr:ATP-binding protein [Sulfuricurvum sp.]MDP2851336.1 ATP-binding protein [Sulfuricurvum sp.]